MSNLPYSAEIEQALLSILLRDNKFLEDLPTGFLADHFYDPLHQRVFKAIVTLSQKGHLASPITLSHYFKKQTDGQGQEDVYLSQLATLLIPAGHAKEYAEHIYDFFLRRQLTHMGQSLIHDVQILTVDGPTARDHIERLEHKLFNLDQRGQERGPEPFSKALHQAIDLAQIAYKRDSHVVGVATGFIDLDRLLGGLHPSDLLILAGRPSMGKTALATNIAFNTAKAYLKNPKEGAPVGFFSLEMSSEQLAMRLLGQESGLSSDRIRRGAIDQNHFQTFAELARDLQDLPLFIDDSPGLSIAHILTRARRLKRKENIGLIVIDYLQLLSSSSRSYENRVQELSEITRGLKGLAKELHIPVLALSQLSRAVELREDKRPQLSDLRESGTIEQDSDVVMFVYREEYYLTRAKPVDGSEKMAQWQKNFEQMQNRAEVLIAKQRHGPIANVALYFDAQRTKFSNLVQDPVVP